MRESIIPAWPEFAPPRQEDAGRVYCYLRLATTTAKRLVQVRVPGPRGIPFETAATPSLCSDGRNPVGSDTSD